jgi:hypothetical protein
LKEEEFEEVGEIVIMELKIVNELKSNMKVKLLERQWLKRWSLVN